jgi:phage baseplate assembly protein W
VKSSYPSYLSFPFRVGPDGRTARPGTLSEHVRDELVQLILTAIGERLFLPEFGTNLRRLVFENVDDTALGLTRATVTQALSKWLGHRLAVQKLDIEFADGLLTVDLSYRVLGDDTSHDVRFQRRLD